MKTGRLFSRFFKSHRFVRFQPIILSKQRVSVTFLWGLLVKISAKGTSCRTTAKEKKPSYSSLSTRPFETAALIFRAAVSLRLHKPMTTCRDTVADWRLIYRVLFAFSKFAWFTSVKKSIAPPPGKYNIVSALSFYVIRYNSGCFWRASFPSRKSGVFCCHFFGDDPVVCRCRSPPPFDSLVNHPWIEMEVHNEEN